MKREDKTVLALTEHVEERKVMERNGASGEEEKQMQKKIKKSILYSVLDNNMYYKV